MKNDALPRDVQGFRFICRFHSDPEAKIYLLFKCTLIKFYSASEGNLGPISLSEY